MRPLVFLLLLLFLLVSCTPTPPVGKTHGAGFRYSIYSPAYDPGSDYWTSVAEQMSALFPNAYRMGIWIIGDIEGNQVYLNFPSTSSDPNILFVETD